MYTVSRTLAGLICLWTLTAAAAPQILINEIMYHPSSELTTEEYVELYNAGPTNVNLLNWHFTRGVTFTFPSYNLAPNSYVAVAANTAAFTAKYPSVANVIGGWTGILSNSRDTLELDDANGQTVDTVAYADEGDWAQRQRGLSDFNHRGWTWYAEHDGLGKSLELINRALPNEHGQNWASSITSQGTPGRVNSVATNNVAPLILQVQHAPIVPSSTDMITITASMIDEEPDAAMTLFYRIDANPEPVFSDVQMFDDGQHGDGLQNDGRFGVKLGPFPNNTVLQFYVEAEDIGLRSRTWPGPTLVAPDQSGPPTQSANALLQVDDSAANHYQGGQPVYKMIMREGERSELAGIPPSGDRNSDAQMNATWISMDGGGTELRYLCGVRNRGHGSRGANPPNYRFSFVSDRPWKDVTALNLNTRGAYLQVLGATVALKAGAVGGYSRAAQLRVNNANLAQSGSPMFGSYAANEAETSDWAEQHFPLDGGGNLYKVVRDMQPPNFDYRGPDPNSYRNTYFKQSNSSEDDWTDLIGMLQVMGENSTTLFTEDNIRRVIDPDQWLRHLAVMNIMANGESGLNTGNNDDYYIYAGLIDRRMMLVYHDLDSVLGQQESLGSNTDIFRATGNPASGDSEGSWRAMLRFMHTPLWESHYYRILQDLIDTTFSAAEYDPLVDQTLGSYVDSDTINSIKNWMSQRRSFIQAAIASSVQPSMQPPVATITGEPRSPTPIRDATLIVGGERVTHYRYKVNNGFYSSDVPVSTPISLAGLAPNSTNRVYVIGRTAQGVFQAVSNETVSLPWIINTSWPSMRLNEVLARNVAGTNHEGTFPDYIELFNEGTSTVDLSGLQLTDDTNQPNKFVFPNPTMLGVNQYLVVYANNVDGTSGLHTGFALDQDGEGVFLYDAASRGGALLDSVVFGFQIADRSIGRIGNRGDWLLGTLTPGATNVAETLGDPNSVAINEWLAANGAAYPNDFLELYNPAASAIALGGLYLTDEPIGYPRRQRIHPLSFIASHDWVVFDSGLGATRPRKLSFNLSAEVGQIALLSPVLTVLDCVSYGPQAPDVSSGRCPDGSSAIKPQAVPSPGSANVCPVVVQPMTSPLVAYNFTWKYDETGANLGTSWREPAFSDTSWLSGPGVLARQRNGGSAIPEPVGTVLNVSSPKVTYYFRARFNMSSGINAAALQVSHIIDDGFILYLNGQEIYRYNMPSGAVTFQTLAPNNVLDPGRSGPFTLPLTGLLVGPNVLAAEVHQNSASSQDICFGLKLDAIIASTTPGQIVINEVFANNVGRPTLDGATPDLVEFFNPSASDTIALTGMTVTDDINNRQKWAFPAGSVIAPRGLFSVRFDDKAPSSSTNTGFGLNATGDTLYLFRAPADGGGLVDSNRFGLQLADFSVGRVPDGSANWTLTLPTIGSTNLPATLGNAALIRVNEWMAAPSSGDDWFELFNPNPQPVAIGGFFLTDDLNVPDKQPLPPLSFLGAISNAWQRFEADNNPAAGANHTNFKLDADHDNLGLFSATGALIDAISFTNQQTGISQGRLPDGQPVLVAFTNSPSPGHRNYLLLDRIYINEALSHTDDPLEDAIELYNSSASPLAIGGWWLSDSGDVPQKFQIPPNTTLAPGGYAVYYEGSFNASDVAAIAFALSSADGDQVILSAVDGTGTLTGYRAQVEFGPAENGVSFGRYLTSIGADFVAMSQLSFGVNHPIDVPQFRMGMGQTNPLPLIGPIVITEIMFQPPTLGGLDNQRDEFIELFNPGATAFPLFDSAHPTNTWRLRKGVDFDFPTNIMLTAGGSLLVVSFNPDTDTASKAAFESVYGTGLNLYGPFSGKLDNDGEAIELQKPDPPQTIGPDIGKVPYVVVERIRFAPGSPWPAGAAGTGLSLQRIQATSYGNEPLNWFAAAPTPGPAGLDDSDHDGIPDDWETAHNLDPHSAADAGLDPDQDGFTNREEYDSGTDPHDSSSFLQLLTVRRVGSSVSLFFEAAADRSYSVYWAASLPAQSWTKLTSVPAQATARTVEVTDSAGNNQRFYRVGTP